jgi:regulation of enolase protein 1 (concanavalin A-like superfamily)
VDGIEYSCAEGTMMFEFSLSNAKWFFEPPNYLIEDGKVTISTEPNTDFWQRTYYGFRNDNAHVLYNTTDQKYFSFTVKTHFNYNTLFDQCGIAIYQDSENWVKAGIEFHDKNAMWLGSVVTNNGYSDWATVDIDSKVKSMWYRLSRRESDFLIENSNDGITYNQMRIFHFVHGDKKINFGLLACSPGKSTFDAIFTDMNMSRCVWEEHRGN